MSETQKTSHEARGGGRPVSPPAKVFSISWQHVMRLKPGTMLRLKQYTQGTSAPLVVLHNFPSVDSQAHAFVESRHTSRNQDPVPKGSM